MLAQQLANGVLLGVVYSMLAIGFSLMYSTTRVINFAHGDMFVLASFIALQYTDWFRVPYLLAAPVSALTVAALTYAFALASIRFLHTPLLRSIATILLALATRDGMLIAFGSDTVSFPTAYPATPLQLAGISMPASYVIIAAIITTAVVGLTWALRRTTLGLQMRAASQDETLAATCGIDVRNIGAASFAAGTAMAALAGVLIAPTWLISYAVGGMVGMKAFVAALIGGLGSLRGAVVGGILVGLLESMFAAYVSSTWKDLGIFAFLLVFLVVFPHGILSPPRGRLT